MKILFNASAGSVHTIRWANAMAESGHAVWVHTLCEPVIPVHPTVRICHNLIPSPIGYFLGRGYFNRIVREFQPDLIHSMHSGNYAIFTRGIRHIPVLLSTWGGDIHVWPYRNVLTRYLTLSNLRKHKAQSATSQNMVNDMVALRGQEYPIDIVPYGVDLERFRLKPPVDHHHLIRIGAVKNLIRDSGLDLLIRAFSDLTNDTDLLNYSLSLEIVGSGKAEEELKDLVKEIGLENSVTFLGQLPHDDVPAFMSTLDIFCSLSRRESFGVSIAEASAIGLPVVATNIQGILEIIEHDATGYLVPPDDVFAATEAIKTLILDPSLRDRMGSAGRNQIKEKYEWSSCVDRMEALYKKTIATWTFLFIAIFSASGQHASVDSFEWSTYWNSARPSGQNDGWVWQGKGYTTEAGLAMHASIPFIKLNLRPSVRATQNLDFEQNTLVKSGIDLPDRMYATSETKFALVNSSLFLEALNVGVGVSNENRWWGPGVRNSIILSNHAPGFDHVRVQTVKPQNVGIGTMYMEYILGRLVGSEVRPERFPKGWRLFTGMHVAVSPSFIPGLRVGLNRTFIANQQDVNSTSDYFPLFQSFQKKNLGEGSDGSGSAPDDQRVSAFFDWRFSNSGFRVYGEFGREDHNMDLRDVINEPGHARAYLFGVEKSVERHLFQAEFTQMQVNTSTDGRTQGIWYAHSRVRRGYTHEGQVLGSGVGPGGTSAFLHYTRRNEKRSNSIYVERAEREVEYARRAFGPNAPKEVDYIIGLNTKQVFEKVEFIPEVEYMRTENRYYLKGNAVNNIAFRVHLRYRL